MPRCSSKRVTKPQFHDRREVCSHQTTVNVQVLLLLIGRIFQRDPTYIVALVRSSVYINAISNRLAAASPRSQFLGMVVGNSVSNLVDKDKRLNFSMDSLNDADAEVLQSLITCNDDIGSIETLADSKTPQTPHDSVNIGKRRGKQIVPEPVSTSKVMAIEEIHESGGDDDIPVYAKPDSDEEDEDEDPTLVQRNKPTAPV
jgi:telomere length regulation protein